MTGCIHQSEADMGVNKDVAALIETIKRTEFVKYPNSHPRLVCTYQRAPGSWTYSEEFSLADDESCINAGEFISTALEDDKASPITLTMTTSLFSNTGGHWRAIATHQLCTLQRTT